MELEDFSSFIGEFLEEAEENLQAFSTHLLELEKSFKAGKVSPGEVAPLFRAAHTIKGLAGMMDYAGIEELCHKMEDVLGEVRQDKLAITQDAINSLFAGLDILTKQVEGVKTDKTDKGVDATEAIRSLSAILDSAGTVQETGSADAKSGQDAIVKELDLGSYRFGKSEMALLEEAHKAKLSIYEVSKEIVGGTTLEKLEGLPLFSLIAKLGSLITVHPALKEIAHQSGSVNCKILFGSVSTLSQIGKELFDPVRLIRVGGGRHIPEATPEGSVEEKEPAHLAEPIDKSLVEEFVGNSTELLDSIDLNLLELERETGNRSVISKIHDALIQLKGSAAMHSFSKITIAAGSMETLFGEILRGEITVDEETLVTVFDCMEKFKLLLDEVKAGRDMGCSIESDIQKIESLLGGRAKQGEHTPGTAHEEGESDLEERSQLTEEAGSQVKEKGANTIRVEIDRLDKLLNRLGELVIDRTRFEQAGSELKKRNPHDPITMQLAETNQLFHRHLSDIQELVMSVRMVPVSNVFNRFPRIARDLALGMGKSVDCVMSGEDTELDKTLVEEISEPLLHLVRNALDHGIETPSERVAAGKNETGRVELSAYYEGNTIVIKVKDDGRGMDLGKVRRKGEETGLIRPGQELSDREAIQLIFQPGFSTSAEATMVSGRGVGMDVVKEKISGLKGIIDIDNRPGEGTAVIIKLPLTLAIVPTLIVGVMGETYAIPLSSVVESIRISPEEIDEVHGKEMIQLRDSVLPLLRLDKLFQLNRKRARVSKSNSAKASGNGRGRKSLFIVVLGIAEKRLGMVVDELKNQQEVVIKSLGSLLKDAPGISGASIRGDGSVCLILDVGEIVDDAFKQGRLGPKEAGKI